MTNEDRAASSEIELAGRCEPQESVVLEDEVPLILKRARDLQEAKLIKALMEPRRPYLPHPLSTGK